MATKKEKTAKEQIDAIFKRALEEAKAVKCDIEEFAVALDGWRDDIESEIDATGIDPSKVDDEEEADDEPEDGDDDLDDDLDDDDEDEED